MGEYLPLWDQMTADAIGAADPDLSNPTRSRLERPLATIMSFHAAVDGSYGEKPFSRTGTRKSFLLDIKS